MLRKQHGDFSFCSKIVATVELFSFFIEQNIKHKIFFCIYCVSDSLLLCVYGQFTSSLSCTNDAVPVSLAGNCK